MLDLLFVSIKNIKRKKLRSWLTLLGVFIGVFAVVSLISLGDGLRTAITSQLSSLSADTLLIRNIETGFGPPGSTSVKKLTEHDLELIGSVKDIKYVVPRLIRMARVEYNSILEFRYISSLPESKELVDFIYKNLNLEVEKGRLLNPGDRGKILIGADFVKKEDFEKEIKVGSKIKIQGKEFEVVGILKKSSSFQINNVALLLEKDMKEALKIGDEIDVVVIRVADTKKVDNVAKSIEEKFRKDRNLKKGEEDFYVQTPLKALETVNLILNIVNIIVVGIASISLIVGGIGIANTMYTSVLERTKEIGVMKATGAKKTDILSIFIIESGILGLVGGFFGSLNGMLFSYLVSSFANNYFKQNIFSFQISLSLIIGSVIFSAFIGILAGFIPSYQASKLKPAEALRQ